MKDKFGLKIVSTVVKARNLVYPCSPSCGEVYDWFKEHAWKVCVR
jgi:hypothetical protein